MVPAAHAAWVQRRTTDTTTPQHQHRLTLKLVPRGREAGTPNGTTRVTPTRAAADNDQPGGARDRS